MVDYLHLIHPEYTYEQVKSTVQELCKDLIPKMDITYVHHKSPGNSEIKTIDIHSFLKLCNNKILTPSGSIYKTAQEQSSFFVDLIKANTQDRSKAKKKKLEAKAQGNKSEMDYWENQQQQKKYDNNGFSGLLRNAYVGFYDVAGYNSTTSLARKSIYLSYTHTERFLAGNFYLPTFESIINHIFLVKQYSSVIPTTGLYQQLYIPTLTDVLDFILQCYTKYYHPQNVVKEHVRSIKRLLLTCNQDELTYIFYYNNFYQLIKYNSDWLKPLLQEVLSLNESREYTQHLDTYDILKLDEDLAIVLSVIVHPYLQGDFLFKDKKISVQDIEIQKTIIDTGYRLKKLIEETLLPLVLFFCDIPLEIPDIQAQRKMIRQAVVSSDTDSVLYTKDPYIRWYTGSSQISLDSMNISALLDYLLTKSMKIPLRIHCLNHGIDGKDVELINMKNEYTYTIFIAANKPKTYIGGLLIQEGRIFKQLELDIKGSTYKGSIYSNTTLSEYKKFLFSIIDEISTYGSISAVKYIKLLVEREQHIIQTLQEGYTYYLVPKSIRTKNDYKNPESSILFNLDIWNTVFGSKYGVLTPPLKTLCVDIDYKKIRSDEYHEWLEHYHSDIYKKLIETLKRIDTKDPFKTKKSTTLKHITFLPINPVAEVIPEELIPIINYKTIAHKNCKPWYELYQSLSITVPPTSLEYLFSDIYR
jgi:hypothetical protein